MNRAQAAKKLGTAFKATKVSDFVAQFKKIASDPKVQAILKAGLTDGSPDDDDAEDHPCPVGGGG
jgi:hypothetical protein